MRAALVLLVLAGAPRDAPKPAVLAPTAQSGGETKCGACHVTGDWKAVKFNHEKTGFPLKGAHATTGCKECHAVDFEKPIPRGCAGCHTDVHQGELGARCEGCHDEETFRSRMDVDAHRRTAFPLLGGHATLPCTQCHLEAGTRQFSRATVECGSCHVADYQRTRTTAVNHVALGFDTLECRNCHGAVAFKPARFPTHDRCFVISTGGHAGMACQQCHGNNLTALGPPGGCNLMPITCTGCHAPPNEHACSGPKGMTPTDLIHINKQVQGYSCTDARCAQCHQTF